MRKESLIILFSFFALLSLFFSCGNSDSKEACNYNDIIVAKQVKIVDALDVLDSNYADFKSKDLDTAYSNAVKQVSLSIESIRKINNFKDNSDFKDAALKLFETYKSTLENEYMKMIVLSRLPENRFSLIEEKKLEQLSKDASLKLNTALDEFIKKQKEFANKYNFQVED